jgi:phenylacetate-CoA ligase
MNNIIQNIYFKSPRLIQNFAITIYGIKQFYYGNGFIKKPLIYSKQEILNYKNKKLQNYLKKRLFSILSTSANNVPYYKQFYKQIMRIIDKEDVEYMQDVPILSKKIILENGIDNFLNDYYKNKNLISLNTTGTTGSPITIKCNKQVRREHYAYYERYLNSLGVSVSDKKATFGGRILVPVSYSSNNFWRYREIKKNLLLSSYHLNEENIPYYIEKLNTFKPRYIESYPSSIYLIAKAFSITVRCSL